MRQILQSIGRSVTLATGLWLLAACSHMKMDSTPADKGHAARQEARLQNFDDLDFNVFSNQRWDQLPRSHAPDVVVHWPDGRVTRGIDVHIDDLKKMFTYAPDTRIRTHPIRIADLDEDYTAVVGVMEGTFTQPMTLPDGRVVAPTGKAFRLEMVTVSHWRGNVMDEEWLFWDNQAFMKQVGLAP
jgi:hypothetical protein